MLDGRLLRIRVCGGVPRDHLKNCPATPLELNVVAPTCSLISRNNQEHDSEAVCSRQGEHLLCLSFQSPAFANSPCSAAQLRLPVLLPCISSFVKRPFTAGPKKRPLQPALLQEIYITRRLYHLLLSHIDTSLFLSKPRTSFD